MWNKVLCFLFGHKGYSEPFVRLISPARDKKCYCMDIYACSRCGGYTEFSIHDESILTEPLYEYPEPDEYYH